MQNDVCEAIADVNTGDGNGKCACNPDTSRCEPNDYIWGSNDEACQSSSIECVDITGLDWGGQSWSCENLLNYLDNSVGDACNYQLMDNGCVGDTVGGCCPSYVIVNVVLRRIVMQVRLVYYQAMIHNVV